MRRNAADAFRAVLVKWLQCSTNDLEKGLGGVEVHARALARELRTLGVDAHLSSNPEDLRREDWDVVQTHGSGYLPNRSHALSVHTLHGTTLGRMSACGEWTWPGGYLAWARELRGTLESDLTLSVHPGLSLLALARRIGKPNAVCWNGWDSGEAGDRALPGELIARIGDAPFWFFAGRGDDRMKGTDRIHALLDRRPGIRLVAAPGSGFEARPEVLATGRLSPTEVRALMARATGLLIPSRYEGNSLVVLEALAEGLPVVATPVGGVPVLPGPPEGLVIAPIAREGDAAEALERAIARVENLDLSEAGREARRVKNRGTLPTWRKVAETALDAVEAAMRQRKR